MPLRSLIVEFDVNGISQAMPRGQLTLRGELARFCVRLRLSQHDKTACCEPDNRYGEEQARYRQETLRRQAGPLDDLDVLLVLKLVTCQYGIRLSGCEGRRHDQTENCLGGAYHNYGDEYLPEP